MRKILFATAFLFCSPAVAEPNARKITLSQDLVEALFQRLSQDPYASVAPLIAKLQAEAATQLAAPTVPDAKHDSESEK